MRSILAVVIAGFLAAPAWATDATQPPEAGLFRTGETADLSEFLWINRPLVVFADSAADPRYIRQIELLEALPEELATRDVVVLTDTSPATKSALREKLRPRGFMLALVGKDGVVYLRKPLPWSVREITRSIDKLPMRQQEVRDRRGSE